MNSNCSSAALECDGDIYGFITREYSGKPSAHENSLKEWEYNFNAHSFNRADRQAWLEEVQGLEVGLADQHASKDHLLGGCSVAWAPGLGQRRAFRQAHASIPGFTDHGGESFIHNSTTREMEGTTAFEL